MPAATAQVALPFELEEPYLYHDVERAGFFSLLEGLPDGQRRQRSFKLQCMPDQLPRLRGRADVWISQNEFHKPNRQVVNLWRIPLCFIDLDTYKVPSLEGQSPDGLAGTLRHWCDVNSFPQPSLIVFSGRGLQVKWLLEKPLPNRALPRWQAVQRELHRRLTHLGADANSLDASRVLRLVNTVHSGSGEMVRVLHRGITATDGAVRLPSGLVGHDFDIFADAVLPLNRSQLELERHERESERDEGRAAKAARELARAKLTLVRGESKETVGEHPNLRKLSAGQLAWDRLADMRKLAELRGLDDGLPAGQRDLFLFLSSCFLAGAVNVVELMPEISELAREFVPTWSEGDVKSCVSSVLSRAASAARGDTVEFNGVQVSPRYRWRNAKLIDRLSVTPAEERQMRTIVSHAEAARRDAERHVVARKLAGGRTRAELIDHRAQLRVTARLLRAKNVSFPAIAAELGISVGTACNYCKD